MLAEIDGKKSCALVSYPCWECRIKKKKEKKKKNAMK
jgi:hypothetical protein